MLRPLYEDDEILAVNKPAGLPAHALPSSAIDADSAVAQALRIFPNLPENPEHPQQNGLCHRLDSGTSGILIFAKTAELLATARAQWAQFAEIKEYRAIARSKSFFDGKLPRAIEFPLGHAKKSSKRMIAIRHAGHLAQIRGKPLACKTEIVTSERIGKDYSLTLRIHGGVMHQIRAHLAEIGLPILGDPIYGDKTAAPRLMLHHSRIVLKPTREFALDLSCELPPEFKKYGLLF